MKSGWKKWIWLIPFLLTLQQATSQEVLYYCSKGIPGGTWEVFRKDLNTEKIDTISHDRNYNYWWVELSPNYREVLMLRSPADSHVDQFNYDHCEMLKANADGSAAKVIVPDNAYQWAAFGNPHWHPAGDKILMIVQPDLTTNPFLVITIDTAGRNPRLLTTQYSLDPNWSPDGKKIVFIGLGNEGPIPLNFEVFTADYYYDQDKISNIRQLTSDTTRNHDPCFSPDGKSLAFSASNATLTDADLVIIDSSGTQRNTVVNDDGIHGGPLNWGADGKIYHHGIYPGVTDFVAEAFDLSMQKKETLLFHSNYGFISPYYANLNRTDVNGVIKNENALLLRYDPLLHTININKWDLLHATLFLFDLHGKIVFSEMNIDNTEIFLKERLPLGTYPYLLLDANKHKGKGQLLLE